MEWLVCQDARQTLVAALLIWTCWLASLGTVHGHYNQTIGALTSCWPECQNGGVCERDAKTQANVCRCQESYVGQYCQHRDPCYTGSAVTTRCMNRATCQVLFPTSGSFTSLAPRPSFHCQCRLGFSASLCEIPVKNVCDTPSPCQNNGTCLLKGSLTEFTCDCRRGYRGLTCGEVDFCASKPCKNQARCVSGRNGYHCECATGFQGPTCTQDINECAAGSGNVCQNGGTCVNSEGSYWCSCLPGFSGQNCESIYIPCNPNHCKNGGRCYRDQNDRYLAHCDCPVGYTGKACEINRDDCVGHRCQNGGTCVDGINAYDCHCPAAYSGVHCTDDVDECTQLPQPCKNGATCQNSRGGYSCICVNGWTGKHCDQNIDDCTPLVCLNGGTCRDGVSSYKCDCPAGKTGFQCQLDDGCASNPCQGTSCDTNPTDGSFFCFQCPPGFNGTDCSVDLNECEMGRDLCAHGGVCRNTIGSFKCDCAKGFQGMRCEENINECASNPCQNDGTCLDERGNYRCVCMPGFTGINCETDMDECSSRPCQNGGVCRDVVNGYQCTCPIGFSGPTCSDHVRECSIAPCRNGGTCHDGEGSGPVKCTCPPGFGGHLCEENLSVNQCSTAPACQFGGVCVNGVDGFTCRCKDGYSGRFCQCQPGYGGVDCDMRLDVKRVMAGPPVIREDDKSTVCPVKDCAAKAKNGHCDEECNRMECDFDAQECVKLDPWVNCTRKTHAPCWDYFRNGRCDKECNIQECLFDGFDCGIPVGRCEPDFDTSYGSGNFCVNNYANGRCDEICNTRECYFDGLDCSKDAPKLLDGSVIVIVNIPPDKFRMASAPFMQKLGRALRTVAQIQKDKDGKDLITPWTLNGGIAINPDNTTVSGTVGTAIYVQLDNRKCSVDCFETVDAAARYLTAAEQQGTLDLGYPLYSVQSAPQTGSLAGGGTDDTGGVNSNLYWLLIILVVALIAVIAGVTTFNTKRKRVSAVTWFPDGFLKSTSTAVLSDHLGFPSGDFKKTSYDNRGDASTIGSYYDSDTEIQQPSAKRIRGTMDEPRGFTQQHNATDTMTMRKPADMFALTPPSQDDLNSSMLDVNTKGPGGMTPLMLAAMRGSGLDSYDDDRLQQQQPPDATDEEVAHMVHDLLMNGTKLDEADQINGETALHFAARCARAGVVKLLLENGADVTLTDNSGRTALHSAVGAGSSSVLGVLKHCRKVDWNARMADGTTPLMLAARHVMNDFVEEILRHDPDVNLADNSCRTALHWAAVVNNYQGVKMLLHHQAKVDLQDESSETPLYLAAREGNYEAARELLDFHANMELPNDMDKTPRDIAHTNRFPNLVRLLDDQKDVVHSPQQNLSKNMFYAAQTVHLPTINRYTKPGRNKPYFNTLTGGGSVDLQGGGGQAKKGPGSYRRRTPLDMCQMQQGMMNLPAGFDFSSAGKPAGVNYIESPYQQQYTLPKMDLRFATAAGGDWKPDNLMSGQMHPHHPQQHQYGQLHQMQSGLGVYGKYPLVAPPVGHAGNHGAAPSPAMTLHSNDQTYVSNMSSSPDSPGQWSSSPHSEWSDGTGMPSPKAMMTRMNPGFGPAAQAQQSFQYVSSTIGDGGLPFSL